MLLAPIALELGERRAGLAAQHKTETRRFFLHGVRVDDHRLDGAQLPRKLEGPRVARVGGDVPALLLELLDVRRERLAQPENPSKIP